MKTPKQRFLEFKDVAARHRDIVDSTPFAVALDMALLQVIWDLKAAGDVQSAAAEHWKLHGAITYMKTLEGLGNVTKDRASIPDDNLVHTR